MELFFTCPSCNVQMQIEAQYANRDAKCPECEADISIPPLTLGPGIVLGGFLLERKLGSGSMGDVYLAEQISMRRKVALKILPATMTRDPQAVERFLHEVKTLGRFEHPNIVQAFDAGEDDGTYYLAMSYVNGEDLDRIVKRDGPFPEKKAIKIIRKVAIALKFAWEEHQLLHRDIKPENVMIDHLGEIRLMDMGISKSVHEDSNLTMPGIVFGTPHYMSPEQAWSEDAIDFRADLYSLGASLYRMIVGDPPYTGPSQTVFAKLAKPDPFPLPRVVNEEISEPCDHLIDVMMAPKPEQRYQNWDACIADIDRVIAGRSPELPRPPREGGSEAQDRNAGSSASETQTGTGMKLRPVGGDKSVIQPKDRKSRPKLTLSRTEQMKAPPIPAKAGSQSDDQEADSSSESSDTGTGLQLKSAVKRKQQEKPAPPPPPTDAPAIGEEDALPSEVSGKSGKRFSLKGASLVKLGILAAVALLLLLIAGVVMHLLFNPDKLGDMLARFSSGTPDSRPPTSSQPAERPETQQPDRQPAAQGTSQTPASQPTQPPAAAEPTLEELAKRVASTVSQRTANLKVDEAAIARQLGLEYPVQPPRLTPAEIEELAARQAKALADKNFPLEQKRAEVRQEALHLFGAFEVGQEVYLVLRRGSGPNTTVRGTIRELAPTRLKVGDRTISVRDLDVSDKERMDKDVANQNVQNFIDRNMADLEEGHARYLKKALEALIESGHEKSGYTKKNGEWISQLELFNQRVEQQRRRQVRQIRQQVEQSIYGEYGYERVGNKWQKTRG